MQGVNLLGDVLLVLRKLNSEVINLSEHDPRQRSDGGERDEDDDQSSRTPTDAPTFQESRGGHKEKGKKGSESERDKDLSTKVQSRHDENRRQERGVGNFQFFASFIQQDSPAATLFANVLSIESRGLVQQLSSPDLRKESNSTPYDAGR